MVATHSPSTTVKRLRAVRRFQIEHLLALAGVGDRFVLGDDKTIAPMPGHQKLASPDKRHDGDKFVFLFEIDEQAAPARRGRGRPGSFDASRV